MALTVKCPITGYCYKLPAFGTDNSYRISALHPLLDCALEELNTVQVPNDHNDKAYLLLAYLWQVNDYLPDTVSWQHSLLPAKFSHMFLLQQIPRLKLFVNWLAINRQSTAALRLPGFRINKDTRQHDISNWLDACFHIKETETKPLLDGTAARIATKNQENSKVEKELDSMANAVTYQKNRTRKAYIAASLSGHESDKIELVTKVIFRTSEYDVGLIRAVKNYCMDFLLEEKADHFYEKQDIINKLYKVIGSKITVAKALDLESESTEEAEKDFNETFTIEHKGKEYYNSILNSPSLAKLDSKLKANKPKITVPESEPKPEDYDHPVKFKVAYNIWKNAQNRSSEDASK